MLSNPYLLAKKPFGHAESVLCPTRKVLQDVEGFYTLRLLGGGRFFQRDSPSPPPRRLHRAFFWMNSHSGPDAGEALESAR